MELNYLNSFKFYCIFTDLGPHNSRGVDRDVGGIWGYGGVPTHMHTCTYMLKYTCKEIVNGLQHVYHD